MARELAAADSAAVYGRIGTCTQEFGTLASWLVDVLNVLTGNLDREGGAMFTTRRRRPAQLVGRSRAAAEGFAIGRWKSRVRGLPEALGELPVSCLAEEIDTPGEGQVRALITAAGNPLVSTPNSGRLERAVEGLDFMLSIDIYLNETTRHADVILPAPGTAGEAALRPGALPAGRAQRGQLLAGGAAAQRRARGVGDAGAAGRDRVRARARTPTWTASTRWSSARWSRARSATSTRAIAGRDPAEILAELEPRRGPERMLDLLLRAGPYGDAFGDDPDGLTLARLEESPHGIDLGPLSRACPRCCARRRARSSWRPRRVVADVPRLREALGRADGDMVLVGRRQLRSNNSWMHNLEPLVKGKDRCTAHVHPDDAERLGLADGGTAPCCARAPGEIEAPGGGDRRGDARRGERAARLGPRRARHADGRGGRARRREQQRAGRRDRGGPVSGNAVLNGIPVEVTAAGLGASAWSRSIEDWIGRTSSTLTGDNRQARPATPSVGRPIAAP